VKLCLLISLFIGTVGKSQSVEQYVMRADSSLKCNNDIAALEYAYRVLFYDHDKQYHAQAWECIALVKEKQSDYQRASLAYQNAAFYASNGAFKLDLQLNEVFCLIMTKQYHQALANLNAMEIDSSKGLLQKKYAYLGIAYLLNDNLAAANTALHTVVLKQDFQLKLDSIVGIYQHQTKKKPIVAKRLSYIFPGLGQCYARDYKGAVNALVLNGLLGYAGVVVTQNYNFINAISCVSPWFLRYYTGGAMHAGYNLEVFQLNQKEKMFKSIIQLLKKYII
jgi:tetratricopeptide (TPR) repeat protein